MDGWRFALESGVAARLSPSGRPRVPRRARGLLSRFGSPPLLTPGECVQYYEVQGVDATPARLSGTLQVAAVDKRRRSLRLFDVHMQPMILHTPGSDTAR